MRSSFMVLIVAVFFAGGNLSLQADSNLHVIDATMTDCGCEYFIPAFPAQPEWVCFANLETTAPAEHFSSSNPGLLTGLILEGQALGQCSAIHASLPRKVRALFYLQPGGPHVLGYYRSHVNIYYFIDLGAP